MHRFNAYRFLVQAKKLLPLGKDNYQLLNYGKLIDEEWYSNRDVHGKDI